MKEQQEKLKQEKFAGDKTLEILSALGIEPPKQSEAKKKSEKMPNSDAELAAYILGLSTEQIVKPGPGASNKNSVILLFNKLIYQVFDFLVIRFAHAQTKGGARAEPIESLLSKEFIG